MARSPRNTDDLIDRLEERIDEIGDRMLVAFVEQIPAYRRAGVEQLADIRCVVRANVVEWLRVVRQHRAPTPRELEGFADSARNRAREGIPLEALLHAYRLGATVGWEAILEESRQDSAEELAAALEVSGGLMRYMDHASRAVAQSYLEEREHMVSDEERHHHQIAEGFLTEGCASPAVKERAARLGLRLAHEYWVVVASTPRRERIPRVIAQRLRDASSSHDAIAVPRDEEVLAFWPAERDDFPAELREIHRALNAEHGPLVFALAGPASDHIDAALEEAHTIVRLAGSTRSGLFRLEDLPLDALIDQAGGRTPAIVRLSIEQLAAAENRGTHLLETLRAYIQSGSLRESARALTVHRNTIAYRLRRIRSITGLDPRVVPDLFLLYAGLRLWERQTTGSKRA